MTASHFPTSTYSVIDKSLVRIGEQEYESLLTYNLFVKTEEDLDFDISINRTDFKVNQQKIDTKFLEISNQYMEALFPLGCNIENYTLKIINLNDIKERILKEDSKIRDQYSGEGVNHIRSQFLTATETDEKLSEFINQLHFMKVLNLGIQKFKQKQGYFLKWNILPICYSEWKGNISYSTDTNSLHFEPKIDNAQEIMDEIINYVHTHEYNLDFEEENLPLYADFNHLVNYTGKTGRMASSETHICIEVKNKFYYQQTFKINTK
ncbi:hypothetical protein [Chryseobacterium shigense]|uniref:Uncharacterized protein n=1 Tax=Chryseobacterium shigense TaxID=297244 RepID=A0A841N6T3_9FLAO|nr:hypothetical protein [Chryseobacterium shigense]MBB6369168.1 hypothetical protein [Chryseobacterium shigense]